MTDVLDHDIPGLTRPTSPGGRPDFLSDVVVELGFASRETVEQAVREARAGTTVSRVLIESGAVNEDQLARATAERYGLDHIDLSVFPVDPQAANLIKPAAARRYLSVPVGFEPDGALIVAVADPADVLGLNDIAVMTKLDVVAAVASQSTVESLVERLPLTPGGPSAPAAPPKRRVSASAPEATKQAPATQAVFWQAGDAPTTVPPAPAAQPAPHPAAPPAGHSVPHPAAPPAPRTAGRSVPHPAAPPVPHPSPHTTAAPSAPTPLPRGPIPVPPPPAPADLPPAAWSPATGAPAADMEALNEDLRAERAAREELERRALAAERRLAEATRTSGEGDRRLGDAQATAEEARKRARELADADRRAEHAREALAELREETDRQREQHAQIERELRTRVASEERRRRALEERLSEVEESVFAAERAFDELGLAQRRMRGALRALVEPATIDDD